MSTQLIVFGSKLYHCQSELSKVWKHHWISLQQHHSLWFTDQIVVFKNRKFQLEIPLILVLTYKRVGPFLNGPKHVALKHVLTAFLLHSYCRTGILQFITDDNFTLTLTIFRFRLCTMTWKDRLVQLDY